MSIGIREIYEEVINNKGSFDPNHMGYLVQQKCVREIKERLSVTVQSRYGLLNPNGFNKNNVKPEEEMTVDEMKEEFKKIIGSDDMGDDPFSNFTDEQVAVILNEIMDEFRNSEIDFGVRSRAFSLSPKEMEKDVLFDPELNITELANSYYEKVGEIKTKSLR